ncbi:glycosyltransferase [Bacillus cytotoxicus]
MKYLADEIIVLDSGSTDKTRDIIIKSFPEVTLHTVQWKEDFSFCRNTLVDYSSGDWIIQIDADEFFIRKSSGFERILTSFL